MNRTTLFSLLFLGAGALLVGGCQSWQRHSLVDEYWGSAQRANVEAMIANPDAPPWGTGPVGLDPGSAERVARRYYEGQQKGQTEQARPVVVIGQE